MRTEEPMRKIENNNTNTPSNRMCMRQNIIEHQKCQLLLWLAEKQYFSQCNLQTLSLDAAEKAMRHDESMRRV